MSRVLDIIFWVWRRRLRGLGCGVKGMDIGGPNDAKCERRMKKTKVRTLGGRYY